MLQIKELLLKALPDIFQQSDIESFSDFNIIVSTSSIPDPESCESLR